MFSIKIKSLLFLYVAVILLNSCTNNTVNDTSLETETSITIETVTEELKKDRTNAGLFAKRAKIHTQEGNLEAALNDIKIAIKIDSLSALHHYTLSEILFAKGDVVIAAEELKNCISIEPKEIKYLLKIAELEFYMQKYKSSLSYLKTVTEIEPYNSQAYYIHGLIFKQLQDTTEAINSLQKSVEYDATNIDAYSQLGILYYEQNNPLAIDYLNNALNLDSQNTETLYAMAMYYQNNQKTEKALEYYDAILLINPNHSNTHYNLGYLEIAVNQNYQSAINHFNDVINVDSTYALAYYMRGLCWENDNRPKKAQQDYLKCLDLKTNFDLAVQGLNRLDILKKL
jgi:tetratricopeptide (TPR) repeat protein